MMSPRPFLFAVAAVAMALGTTAVTVDPAFAADSGAVILDEKLNASAGSSV